MSALLSLVVAALAFAGGAIHFAVIRHHLEFPFVVAGFAVIGATQWAVATLMVVRPSRSTRVAVVAVHGPIIGVWLLSRTVGLLVVPGAETASPVGLADLIATALSVGALVGVGLLHFAERQPTRSRPGVLPRGLVVAIGIVALALAAPAMLAPHDHANHAPGSPPPGHGDHHH